MRLIPIGRKTLGFLSVCILLAFAVDIVLTKAHEDDMAGYSAEVELWSVRAENYRLARELEAAFPYRIYVRDEDRESFERVLNDALDTKNRMVRK